MDRSQEWVEGHNAKQAALESRLAERDAEIQRMRIVIDAARAVQIAERRLREAMNDYRASGT